MKAWEWDISSRAGGLPNATRRGKDKEGNLFMIESQYDPIRPDNQGEAFNIRIVRADHSGAVLSKSEPAEHRTFITGNSIQLGGMSCTRGS